MPLATLALATTLLTGCTHVTQVDPANPADLGLAALSEEAAKERISTLTMRDGAERRGVLSVFAPDTSLWADLGSASAPLPTVEITEVRFVRPEWGALEGLGAGAVLGALIGFLVPADECGGLRIAGGRTVNLCAALLGGGIGAAAGFFVGAIVGDKKVFRLRSSGPGSTLEGGSP